MQTAELASAEEVAEYVIGLAKHYGNLSEQTACSFLIRKFGDDYLTGHARSGFSLRKEVRLAIRKLAGSDLIWDQTTTTWFYRFPASRDEAR